MLQMQMFFLYFVTLSAGVAVVVFAFTAFVPKYRCRIPGCESDDSDLYTDPETGTHFGFVGLFIGSIDPDGKRTIGDQQKSLTTLSHNTTLIQLIISKKEN